MTDTVQETPVIPTIQTLRHKAQAALRNTRVSAKSAIRFDDEAYAALTGGVSQANAVLSGRKPCSKQEADEFLAAAFEAVATAQSGLANLGVVNVEEVIAARRQQGARRRGPRRRPGCGRGGQGRPGRPRLGCLPGREGGASCRLLRLLL